MGKSVVFLFLLAAFSSFGQKPTIKSIDDLIYKGLEMDESKKDSLNIIANKVKKQGEEWP